MSMILLSRLGGVELLSRGPRVSAAAAQWITDAMALIDAARTEALAIVEAARSESDAIRRHARQEGMAEGLAQGQSEIASQLAVVTAATNRYAREIEPALIDAVVVAVGKLVNEAGSASLIERAVLYVRERLAEAEGLTLRVPTALHATAQKAVRALSERHGLLLPMRVEVDTALADDQCVIESSLGRAKLRLDEQLKRLRQALREAFGCAEEQP